MQDVAITAYLSKTMILRAFFYNHLKMFLTLFLVFVGYEEAGKTIITFSDKILISGNKNSRLSEKGISFYAQTLHIIKLSEAAFQDVASQSFLKFYYLLKRHEKD